eukprot:6485070-Karenia_brevis.AAC.1
MASVVSLNLIPTDFSDRASPKAPIIAAAASMSRIFCKTTWRQDLKISFKLLEPYTEGGLRILSVDI